MNKFGYISGGTGSYTYQIGSVTDQSGLDIDDSERAASLVPLSVDKYLVWPAGAENLDPNICDELISGNRLLPSLIEKQIAILYGTGPVLYISSIDSKGRVVRKYIQDGTIESWLDSWQERGMADSFDCYINKCIRSYYYSEGIFTKWIFSRGYASGSRAPGILPVAGLEHINELRCRVASKSRRMAARTDVEEKDFPFVMVGNWASTNIASEFAVYPRFNYVNPLGQTNTPVSYSKNPNHGSDIYASNVFFKGLKHWLRGCNATPEYINSFLENALSVRHHVIIPEAWIAEKREQLETVCEDNARRKAEGQEMIKIKFGSETFEIGDVYSEDLLDRYVAKELQKMTDWLSGRGKNQGKLYATRSLLNGNGDIEKWEIVPVDQKYKEYIEALIAYDKRADMVLLAGKGIDSSISNVSAEGTISKSGSDAYYNYVIYLAQQAIPERVVCRDINYALRLNFPEKYAEGIRIGFYRPTVQQQDQITPDDRLTSQPE